jgi:hypothetical protein
MTRLDLKAYASEILVQSEDLVTFQGRLIALSAPPNCLKLPLGLPSGLVIESWATLATLCAPLAAVHYQSAENAYNAVIAIGLGRPSGVPAGWHPSPDVLDQLVVMMAYVGPVEPLPESEWPMNTSPTNALLALRDCTPHARLTWDGQAMLAMKTLAYGIGQLNLGLMAAGLKAMPKYEFKDPEPDVPNTPEPPPELRIPERQLHNLKLWNTILAVCGLQVTGNLEDVRSTVPFHPQHARQQEEQATRLLIEAARVKHTYIIDRCELLNRFINYLKARYRTTSDERYVSQMLTLRQHIWTELAQKYNENP